MKRTGNIYAKITTEENLRKAALSASLGKRDKFFVKKILENQDKYIERVQKILLSKEGILSPYSVKEIQDGSSGKIRNIYKPKFFPDQIIHWALMLQIEPLIMRGMYQYSCGSVPGRGILYGKKALESWIKKDKERTRYYLKMDIKKFYPSINNELLKQAFRRIIKDEECLWLIDLIIDSAEGLPIGNYTSQWFSNFFLQDLDHFIKEELHIDYYIRYVDDLVLLSDDKAKLHAAKDRVVEFLAVKDLEIKDDWKVSSLEESIDFLGFRFFPDRTILRKRNYLRIRRRVKKIAKKSYLNSRDAAAILSFWGWIKHCDCWEFFNKEIKPFVSIDRAREVTSINGKKKNLRRNSFFRPGDAVCRAVTARGNGGRDLLWRGSQGT
jgi:RNA-directed DNA polymerase